jgi:hypothetical protein
MSRIVTVILIYHRHKPLELSRLYFLTVLPLNTHSVNPRTGLQELAARKMFRFRERISNLYLVTSQTKGIVGLINWEPRHEMEV